MKSYILIPNKSIFPTGCWFGTSAGGSAADADADSTGMPPISASLIPPAAFPWPEGVFTTLLMMSGVEKSKSAPKTSARCAGGFRFSRRGYFFEEEPPAIGEVMTADDDTGVTGALRETDRAGEGVEGEGKSSEDLAGDEELSFFILSLLTELPSSATASVEDGSST